MPAQQYANPPGLVIEATKRYHAVIKTSMGDLTVELLSEVAPLTVNNFVFLAREGFYEDNQFHRVIKDFMIQGGCPRGDGTGGPGYRFRDEAVTRAYTRGTLAMANAGPNTNGSQWFIVHAAQAPLPPNYTIFGALADGDEALEALATAPVQRSRGGENSQPVERLPIYNIEIVETELAPA